MLRITVFLFATAMMTAAVWKAQAQAGLFGRPASVTVVLASTFEKFDGTYTSTQVARICGETDPTQFWTGERAFVMEYPLDLVGNAEILNVAFHSKMLVGGVKQTNTFFVSASVVSKDGGRYPALVVDTEQPAPGHSGTASLNAEGGKEELKVRATDDLGRTLDLSVICQPPTP
jgi:hypothetical protein